LRNVIKIIDSPCGTGKTSWAIEYLNNLSEDKKFIYITPFLNECQRVQDSINKEAIQPDQRIGSGRKRTHFLNLIKLGKNILSTHSLFSDIDDDIILALRMQDYTLILDEAFQTLDRFDMWEELSLLTPREVKDQLTKNNINTLLKKQFIVTDENYLVRWIDKDHPIDKYNKIKKLAERELLYLISDSLLIWSFPYKIFLSDIFREIYVLTYLFDYQIQKYYFDYFSIEYKKYHIKIIDNKYQIIKTVDQNYEIEWKNKVRKLINILENSKLNKIGDIYEDKRGGKKNTALSKTWYEKNNQQINIIQKNIVNYFINITKSKTDDRMWTCFKSNRSRFKSKNLSINDKKYWVAINSRSTNDFGCKSVLAYPVNRYCNPFYTSFFKIKNIEINNNGFAVSELIQWIWRSRIRNGQSISLYLPSQRMRSLLDDFLQNKPL